MSKLSICIALIWSVSACTGGQRFYYLPTTIRPTHFREQHDLEISGGFFPDDSKRGFSWNAAYSPFNNLAISSSGSTLRSRSSGDKKPHGMAQCYDIAVGAYLAASPHTSISLFAGVSAGQAENFYGNKRWSALSFQQVFIQPSFAVQYKWIRYGVTGRLGKLWYTKGLINGSANPDHFLFMYNLEHNAPYYLFQSGTSFGFGYKFLWNDFYFNFYGMHIEDEIYSVYTVNWTATISLHELWRPRNKQVSR